MQNGQTAKGHELLQLRGDYRESREKLNIREEEIKELKKTTQEKDNEIKALRHQIKRLSLQITDFKMDSIEIQNVDYIESKSNIRETLSHLSLNDYCSLESEKMSSMQEETEEDIEIQKLNSIPISGTSPTLHYCKELEKLKLEMEQRKKEFEKEKITWAQEKEKVLKYQRQLQMNYVQMYRKTRALEAEVESLTVELELDKTGLKKKISNGDLSQTIEL